MEIALSGFSQQFGSSASVESARQRQQNVPRQPSAENTRAREEQQSRTRAENSQRAPTANESARVINGEVLSSETRRVENRETGSNLFSRSANQQPSGQPDNRRITSQQAIQTFQENEALVPANNQQRQVSGIIDTYV